MSKSLDSPFVFQYITVENMIILFAPNRWEFCFNQADSLSFPILSISSARFFPILPPDAVSAIYCSIDKGTPLFVISARHLQQLQLVLIVLFQNSLTTLIIYNPYMDLVLFITNGGGI